MAKYKNVTDVEVLHAYCNIIFFNTEIMHPNEYVPIPLVAKHLQTSIYQIRKAIKNLTKQGYMKLETVATHYEEYYNGLYTEFKPVLFTKSYVVTDKGHSKDKEIKYD